nr:Cadherin and Laminin G domain containing protein [Haemonchus contortus]
MMRVLLEFCGSKDNNLEFWIRENAPIGSIVGKAPTFIEGPATYSIVGDIGLSVDRKNGIIKTTTVFDHEERQLYSFKLKSTFQSGEFIEQESLLVIDDENDNSPKFDSDLYSVEIVEDVQVGTEIARLKWSDNDFNNAFHLTIEEGNELCQFDVDSDGRVKVIGELDRERLPVHRLVIRLSDGIAPYPYYTTECVVTVTLRDVNDNSPVFESSPEFLVEENSHRMKVIGRVEARDADEGLNAEIHYRIMPESLPRAEFIIDAVRGDLMVNKPLDFEQIRNYTLTVAAMDHGIPQLVSYQRVTVHVVDVNDHAPILRSSPTTVEIDEVTTRGSPLLRLKVDDEDCIENAASVFEIEKGFGVFDVSPISGVLYVSSPLDFESQSLYNVSVSARNIAGGPKTYSSVIVHVKDNNDERPRFIGGSPVQFSIYENLPGPLPAVIGSTISEDLDGGTNGLVAYSIFKGNASLFSINSASGELLLLNSLDREDCMEHFITVQAIDSGTTRLSSTVEIKITVLDDNDNAPEFDQPYYVIHVRENIKHGQAVLKVTAFDKDEGQNAVVRYSLLEQSPFLIDRITGEIRVNSAVDREEISEYRLTIRAIDSGRFRRLTATARLTVFIDDENDNHPVIRNKLLDVFVPKDFRNGDVVHVVDAIDSDEDSTLFFNISGTDARFFRINTKGEIIAKTVLEMKAYYSVTVGVSDKDGLNTSASFTFYLDDRNNFPRWTSTMNRTSLREDSSGEIFQFAAISSRADSYVTYSILSGSDGSFEIDPLSGKLSVSRELDYEKRSFHRLWIAAVDSDSPPKQSITSIDIVVEDVNDNSPIFDQVIYSVDVMENSDPTQQLCVFATDRDQGDNANISYSIVRGNTLDSFEIDHRTGCIRTTQMLDRESITDFRLVILAEDQGNPPLSTEAIVKVKVLDEDDNAPKFSHLFHAEIPEDLEVGSPVLMISALDPDGFVNHTFSIDNEATTPFFIHPHSGQIYLQRPLDREQTSMYRLRIRVSDGTWAVQTYAAINVLDVNDNAPVFMKQKYVFIVNDSQVNQTFGKVVARDADEGRNGIVYYRLQRDERYISVDPITAEMKLLAVPEKEVTRITVMAQDDGVPAMLSSVAVTVVFAVGSYEACELAVNRDTPIGTKLGNIEEYCNHTTKRKVLRRFLSDESLLTIDSDGDLFVSGVVHKDEQVEYVYEDGAVTVYHMRIELSQGNPNPPIFEKKIFHFAVSEEAEYGDMVGVVYAEDSDPGLAGKLLYRIEADDLPFKIFPNGTVVISGPLDFEAQRRYIFNVIATDRGQTPQRASAQIVIDLLDVDDNPPAVEDAELVYAVTNTEATICPIITDIDTSKEDLQSSVSAPAEIITTDSCIHISDDVPSSIKWTVSDKSQPITVKVVLLDMLPKSPNIHDENVTMSESAVKGTIVSSYGTKIFMAKRSDQLVVDANDLNVSVERGIDDDEAIVYAKSKFGRVLKSSKLQLISSNMAPPPLFSKTTYAFNISDMAPLNTTIHDFQMSVPNDCYISVVSDDQGKTFCFPVGSTLALCGHLRKPHYSLVAEVLCGNRVRSRSEIIITVVPTTPPDYPMVGFLMENVSALAIAQLHSVHGQKFAYRIGDRRLREVGFRSDEKFCIILLPKNFVRKKGRVGDKTIISSGMCSAGICKCLAGFSGVDCSIRNKDRKLKRKRPYELKKPSEKRKMNCSEMKCDGGTCQAEGGRAICHCVGGFEAVDCSKAGQAYSMTFGSFTLAPTEQLRSILAAGALSPADSTFCHGSQSIEIDFRTRKSHGTIVALFYESELAVVEVHASVARYRVFNSYRTPVEITLGSQSVDDGNWHQVVLELSGDRKVITFKVDGLGKQAMSRVVLPSIISADLERIELGVNGMRE